MTTGLSPELEQRLKRIADRQGCSLETLFTRFADQAEKRDFFPGDPYHFFDLSSALICIADMDGHFLYVNPAFCHTLGYDRETLLSRPYKSFVHPDDLDKTIYAEQQLDSGLDISYFENRYRRQDGSYCWLSWATANVEGDYVYAVALDITERKQTEQLLAYMLEQNRRILDTMFDGYLLGAPDGQILEVNNAYCEMIGYSRDDLLEMTVFDLDAMMPEDIVNQNVDEILNEDAAILIETQHRHKDGHLIDVEINNVRVNDGQIASFIHNISERKRLEAQLRSNEKRYRGLVESQTDFVCRYRPDMTLSYVNDAYCTFFNRKREELIGKSFLALAPESEHEAIYARLKEVMDNPLPVTRIYLNYDMDGNPCWVQWIDHGITDETGTVVEVQAVGREITSLIETQKRLAEREEMLSTIFENIPIMVSLFDAQGMFEYVNQYWVDVLGWTAEDMQAHEDIMAAFYPDPEEHQRALAFMLSGETGWQDFKTHTRDGTVVDTSWTNVHLSSGRKLGIGQVITHRVELENQRMYAHDLELQLQKERELNELKDRFVSLISHEFRTPLAVMTISVDLLLNYLDRFSRQHVQDKLIQVQQQIKRMVNLMEDSLRFSKSSAGKTEFVPEPVDLFALCRKVINTYQLMDDANHQITLEGDNGIVQADPRLLEHIVSNLLSNALKYSGANTTVTIQIKQADDQWHISVKDEGVGIPKADLPLLFEPFHRASNVRDVEGTGLGLAIVKDYVEIHHGEISVNSTEGVGTTFCLTLPLYAQSRVS